MIADRRTIKRSREKYIDKLICLFKPRENYLFKCEFERCIAESDQPDEKIDEELEDEDDDD